MAKHRSGQDPDVVATEVQRLAILGELLAIMAHEINNLMTGVLGYADLELAKEKDEESTDNLLGILQCGGGVRDLTRNLLQLARPSGSHANGSVSQAVETTLALFDRQLRKIQVDRDLAPGLPPVALSGGDLRLVLVNLLKNAIDAMEECPTQAIRITASAQAEALLLGVWNSGPAIPPDVLPRMFTPFFTTKPEGRGTGLGLSIARGMVTRAGGDLTARNLPGGGVLFELRLALASRKAAGPRVAAVPLPPRLDGRRVLVVDDENAVREVTKLMVSQLGGGVVDTCASGEQALEVLERETFDAIVLDLRMAGLSGQEVFVRLPQSLQKRVVFVTGDTLGSSTERFLEATQQPALFKPIAWAELLEAVRKVALGVH